MLVILLLFRDTLELGFFGISRTLPFLAGSENSPSNWYASYSSILRFIPWLMAYGLAGFVWTKIPVRMTQGPWYGLVRRAARFRETRGSVLGVVLPTFPFHLVMCSSRASCWHYQLTVATSGLIPVHASNRVPGSVQAGSC